MTKIESYKEVATDIIATVNANCFHILKLFDNIEDASLHQRALEGLLVIRDESLRALSELRFGVKSDGTYGKLDE